MRCTGGICKGCDLEEGQNLRIANRAVPQTPNISIFDSTFGQLTLTDYPSQYQILEPLDSVYGYQIAPSSPIYLQKLSLLC